MYLKKKYKHYIEEKLKELCSESVLSDDCFAVEKVEQAGQAHHEVAEIFRKQRYMLSRSIKFMESDLQDNTYLPFVFIDLSMKDSDYQQFLYNGSKNMIDREEIQKQYERARVSSVMKQEEHLYLLVHGYQGCTSDMKLIRNIMVE